MSVPATESFPFPITPPALAMGSFGQSVTVPSVGGGPGYSLVSYLTAPLPNASRLDYVVLCHEDADDWRWNFRSPGGKWSFKSTSGEPVANFVFGGVGTLEVEVEVLKDGKRRALLTLSQAVVAPGTAFATVSASVGAAGGDMEFALREICEDFRTYINDAAAATGPNGIPSRLLAAVLFMEVRARPKDDSPKAMIIRGKLAGQSYDPRMDAFEESVARAKGSPIYRVHLHDIREVELDLIRGALNGLTGAVPDPSFLAMGKKSIGLGQIAMTTAAMTAGKFAWRDVKEATRAADLAAIEAAFRALTMADFLEIFNLLRFPRTAIVCAARLLEKIKNRPHRFPGLTARQVLSNPRAIGVIATEYNRGAFDTPTLSFKENGNGLRAREYVAVPSSIGLDRFFPDPPP